MKSIDKRDKMTPRDRLYRIRRFIVKETNQFKVGSSYNDVMDDITFLMEREENIQEIEAKSNVDN